MSSETNRRLFISNGIKLAAASAAAPLLSSCSTFDEYLFEDSFYLKDQVVIAGGGISGLFLAQSLRRNKMGFKLFEGSARIGGRIQSSKQVDYGASIYRSDDELLKKLVKELELASAPLDKSHLFLIAGMQDLTDRLFEHLAGLIVYRSVRLRWKAIAIQKINEFHEVEFDTPRGRRTFVTKKLALAIPPSQWASIQGLGDLPEMKNAMTWAESLRRENTVKVILTSQQQYVTAAPIKNLMFFEDESLQVRQIVKKNKSSTWIEIDFKSNTAGASIEIEKINDFIKRKMKITFNVNKMSSENYFDWNRVRLIQGSAFTSPLVFPEIKSNSFQVVGDFASALKPQSLEGALQSALRAAEFLS
ncbi:MAG: FAD-dependent oxidoreductase [Bdellovibrionaceae bacterium]|nr:FAD-dependent oxidoreductase [Bdellovibrio sp.]